MHHSDSEVLLRELRERYADFYDHNLLDAFINGEFQNEIVVSSSFGAEAAVLLHMVSEINRDTPIIFLDTGHLFAETIAYKETIADCFKLSNIITVTPDPVHLENADSDGSLWQRDHDYCCHIRKVVPLQETLNTYKAWVTGRKRFQSDHRSTLEKIELDRDGRIKLNPLFNWTHKHVLNHFEKFNLPKHPLYDMGYPSIGCNNCTNAVSEDGDLRSGRWEGSNKTECGIHL